MGETAADVAGEGILTALVGFGRALRDEGLVVGSGAVLAFCRAVASLDPADAADVYWAGRACLVSRQGDLETYDRVFRAYFLGERPPAVRVELLGPPPAGAAPEAETRAGAQAGEGDEAPEGATTGTVASAVEILRSKRFDRCTPEELEAIRRLMAGLRVAVPDRRIRRTRPARRGRYPDLRRTARRAFRTEGEVLHHARRRRRERPRRLVLILDVSGSMAEYSRALVQFAHSATAGLRQVEVFCFGTRLSRVTEALRTKDPDEALREAARAVHDWEGGTRIGDSLREFIRRWGRHGLARGAVVVVCSDGLERGDPAVLAEEMERLSRLAHRIVWVNPLKGDPGYEPLARGMQAALPHVDVFVSGHDLASLEALAALLPALA